MRNFLPHELCLSRYPISLQASLLDSVLFTSRGSELEGVITSITVKGCGLLEIGTSKHHFVKWGNIHGFSNSNKSK